MVSLSCVTLLLLSFVFYSKSQEETGRNNPIDDNEWNEHSHILIKHVVSDLVAYNRKLSLTIWMQHAVVMCMKMQAALNVADSFKMLSWAEGLINGDLVSAMRSIAPIYAMSLRANSSDDEQFKRVNDLFQLIHSQFEILAYDTRPSLYNLMNQTIPAADSAFYLRNYQEYEAILNQFDLDGHFEKFQWYNQALASGSMVKSNEIYFGHHKCQYYEKMEMTLARLEVWITAAWTEDVWTWEIMYEKVKSHFHIETQTKIGMRILALWSLIIVTDLTKIVFIRHACYGMWNMYVREPIYPINQPQCHIYPDCCDFSEGCETLANRDLCRIQMVATGCRYSCKMCKFRAPDDPSLFACIENNGYRCCDNENDCPSKVLKGECATFRNEHSSGQPLGELRCALTCNFCGTTTQQDLQSIASKLGRTASQLQELCKSEEHKNWCRIK